MDKNDGPYKVFVTWGKKTNTLDRIIWHEKRKYPFISTSFYQYNQYISEISHWGDIIANGFELIKVLFTIMGYNGIVGNNY